MKDCKLRDGYRVVGVTVPPHETLHSWYFATLEGANQFAQTLVEMTGREVDVCKYIGSWRPAKPPTEFVPADDSSSGDKGE